MIRAKDNRRTPIYLDYEIDDLDLDPYAFRAYIRLVRKAGNGMHERGAYESVKNMAEACQMSERRMHQALRDLESAGLVTRKENPGAPSTYHLVDKSRWGSASGAGGGLHEVQRGSASGADHKENKIREQEQDKNPLRESLRERLRGEVAKRKPDPPPAEPEDGGEDSEDEDSTGDEASTPPTREELILALWREHKRPEWVDHRTVSKRAVSQYRELESAYGREAAPVEFALALQWAATREQWAKGEKLTLENLGSNSKWLQYADKAHSDLTSASARAPEAPQLGEGDKILYRGLYGHVKGHAHDGYRLKVKLQNGSMMTLYPHDVEVFDRP